MLKRLEQDKDIVIFKGTGKVFCAGGDVKQMIELSLDQRKAGYRNSNRISDLVSNYKKPYAAFMDGVAMGGASYFSIPSRFCIATERTIFAMPETSIGYFNDAGSSFFLPRLRDNLGIYLGLTGARVNGFDVKKFGLATHYIESNKLDDVESKLIFCKSHDEVEQVLKDFVSIPPSTDSELDSVIPKIANCFGAATVEGIYENLHEDASEWAVKTLKTLNRMSPTSLKVSHRNFTLGRTSSLRDCLKREWLLVIQHFIKSDLNEGCRAMLVDKDFKPQWNPKTIYEVSEEQVARFFQPSPDGDELTFEKSQEHF